MNEYQEQHIQTFSQGREAAQHAMKKIEIFLNS